MTDYEYDAMDRLVRVIKAAGTMMSRCRSTPMMLRAVWCVLMMVYASIRTFYDYAGGGRLAHTCVDGVKAAEFGIEDQGRTVWVRDYASAQALDAGAL